MLGMYSIFYSGMRLMCKRIQYFVGHAFNVYSGMYSIFSGMRLMFYFIRVAVYVLFGCIPTSVYERWAPKGYEPGT